MILDPYRPADHKQRLADLRERVERERSDSFFLNAVAATFVAAVMFVIGLALTALLGDFTVWILFFSGAVWSFLMGCSVAGAVSRWHHRKELRRLSSVDYEVRAAAPAHGHLRDLAQALEQLPTERREECRPLWAAALQANALLLVDPEDGSSVHRIQRRGRAAQELLLEEQKFAAAEQQAAREQELELARSRYGSEDDSDLELARIYSEALREGRERYQALGRRSTLEA